MQLIAPQKKITQTIGRLFSQGAPAILLTGARGSGKSTVLSCYRPAHYCLMTIQCNRESSLLLLIEATHELIHNPAYPLSSKKSNAEYIESMLPQSLQTILNTSIKLLHPKGVIKIKQWPAQKKKDILYAIQQILKIFSIKFKLLWRVDDIDQADELVIHFFNRLHQLSGSNLKILFSANKEPDNKPDLKIGLNAAQQIELSPLTHTQSQQLLSKLKQRHLWKTQALIIEIAQGNPSKIISLASLSINPSLAQFHKQYHHTLIQHHKQNANQEESALINLIAALKEPTPFKVLSEMTHQPEAQLKATASALEKKAILTIENDCIQIAHRHIQRQIYKSIPPKEREQIHIACAHYFLKDKENGLWHGIKQINLSSQYATFEKAYPELPDLYYQCAKQLIKAKKIKEARIFYTQRMAHSTIPQEKLTLQMEIANCNILLGCYHKASSILEAVANQTRAKTTYQAEFMASTVLLCKTYSLASLHAKAIKLGIAALQSIGLDFSNTIEAQSQHYKAYNEDALKSSKLNKLTLTKKERKGAVQYAPKLINAMLSSAYIMQPPLYELLINYALYDCFAYGLQPEHQSLLMHYALGLQKNRQYLLAKQIAHLALSLDNEQYIEIKLESYTVYYLTIMFWTRPYAESDAFAQKVKQMTRPATQNEYFFHIMTNEAYIHYLQQKPLLEINTLLSQHINLTQAKNIKFSTEMLIDLQNTIEYFTIEATSYRNSTQENKLSNHVTYVFSQLCRCEQNIHFNEIIQANEKLLSIKVICGHVEGTPPSILYPFYLCMVYYQPFNIDITPSWPTNDIVEALSHLEQLALLCPDNFRHRYLMALSLKQHHQGDITLAIHNLNSAIEQAEQFRFLRDTALCYRYKALIEKNNIHQNMQHAITYYQQTGISLNLSTLYDLTFNNHQGATTTTLLAPLSHRKPQQLHATTQAHIIDINSASIAHQLAQPLTAITTQIETILIQKKKQKNDPNTILILEKSKQALLDMGNLIHRLKNQSKAEDNIRSHAFLSERLKKIIRFYEDDLITFTLTIETTLKKHPIELDWVYFEQCLVILINNSLEACPPEEMTTVFIACHYDSKYLHILFHDHGPGIPQAIRPLIFNSPYTSKEKGTGIGLSLAKTMLNKAKGDIELIDKAPGAHFHITLPMDLKE